jgi:hypothetical protein
MYFQKKILSLIIVNGGSSELCIENPLWLMGVDAPITQKHTSKGLKNLKKISWRESRHFMFSYKVSRENDLFCVSYVKKIQFRYSKIAIYEIIFCIFYKATKNIISLLNYWVIIEC